MKFTLSWLKDHLQTDATLTTITDTLTDVGLEVEGVQDRGARLAGFTIAQVLDAVPHPDADKLRVCRVLTDEGERQIVCGAPNARAGITVVLAKPGTYVPGIDATINVGKIRGVESHGMLCSEREMELSEEHDGIIELPSGTVGERFVDWLAVYDPAKVDPVVEIKITPNRGDALAIRGIARDLAARGVGVLKPAPVGPVTGQFDSPVRVTIDADAQGGCPHFCLQMVRGVRNGPSPQWLQDRLRAIGLRPISFLVDVTNFFTHDRGRPLHVFDAGRVAGHLRVHRAIGGETVAALDGKSYALPAGAMVIADDHGPEAIAGIMGGSATGVSDDTVDVLIESAWWDPIQTARTGRALKLHSDARYRFERGVDPVFTADGLTAAVRMIIDHAGGVPSHMVVAGQAADHARAYRLDTDRVVSLVGMDIAAADQRATLTALGFRLDGDMAYVPSWRPDVQGDADLVEEVARIASLTRLQGRPLPRLPGVARPVLTTAQVRLGAARRAMAAAGYHECVSYSFIDARLAALFGGGDDARRLDNPIAADLSHMRPSLLPGLLAAAARNQARGFMDLALFEAGDVFSGGEPGEQRTEITGLLIGRTGPKDPHGAARAVDLFDVKGDAETVLAALGAPAKVQVQRTGDTWWHPGRHGVICLGPKVVLGVYGELHPRVLRALDIKGPAVALTLWPQAVPLPRATGTARTALKMNDLQSVERDFAFVVGLKVEALTAVNAALGADKVLIAEVRLFDEFDLPDGQKSLGLTVRLEPQGATLTDAEIEALAAKVVDKVTKATGGVLRR